MYPRVTYAGSSSLSRYRHWLNPFYILTNVLFFLVYYPCLKTSRITWNPDYEDWLAAHARSDRPLIYYTWHAYSWWFISAVMALPAKDRPVGISNDGIMSRMNSGSSTWFGVDMVEFRRHAADAPREQIARFVDESGRSIMIFPDAGGPYRRIKPGLITIARATGSGIVPVVLDVRPRVPFGFRMKHLLPVPFARLRVRLGEPIDPVDVTPASLAAELETLEAELADSLRS